MKWAIQCILWLLVLACCGCSPGVGQVSGVVTHNGKPLPGGTLTFRPAEAAQNSVAYVLESDGKFRVTLPVGEVAICVDNREFEPQQPTIAPNFPALKLSPEAMKELQAAAATDRREAAGKSGRYMKIPEKYYTVETSGLTITVKKGEQTSDIELKD